MFVSSFNTKTFNGRLRRCVQLCVENDAESYGLITFRIRVVHSISEIQILLMPDLQTGVDHEDVRATKANTVDISGAVSLWQKEKGTCKRHYDRPGVSRPIRKSNCINLIAISLQQRLHYQRGPGGCGSVPILAGGNLSSEF